MQRFERTVPSAAIVAGMLLAVVASACSSGSSSKHVATTRPIPVSSTTTAPARPAGPAADLSKEITGGGAPFIGEAAPPNLKKDGYVEHEYVASGTATSYKAADKLARDGRWSFTPDTKASYRTRILVRRPANAADFSGTVVVEWNNVSAGIDADAD